VADEYESVHAAVRRAVRGFEALQAGVVGVKGVVAIAIVGVYSGGVHEAYSSGPGLGSC
jgi:hypothetical protein